MLVVVNRDHTPDTTTTTAMASPTPGLREELNKALGPKSEYYWNTLKSYLSGKIARVEFEELVREVVNTSNLSAYVALPPT